MQYRVGNICDFVGKVSAIVVTTNGFVKKDGTCVMGAGFAKQMAEKYPEMPKLLGDAVKANGNVVNFITEVEGTKIYSFPTKPCSFEVKTQADLSRVVSFYAAKVNIGDKIPGFMAKSSVSLIEKSARELAEIHKIDGLSSVLLPLPGCGAGELSFKKDVESLLSTILNHKFYLMSYRPDDFRK